MDQLTGAIEVYGLAFVFLNVLASQAGLPLPAYPTLVVAAGLLIPEHHSFLLMAVTAAVAALVADSAWFAAGSRFGHIILRTLCRVSLSPDGCVRQTENIYTRFGPPSLVVAKFIPGFAAVATGMAGALHTSLWEFLLFDGLGALLWASVALGLGMIFKTTVTSLMGTLAELGEWGLALILLALVLVLLGKWWQRQRFYRELRMARISVDELRRLLESGEAPVILDVRSSVAQDRTGRIPGAITVDEATVAVALANLDVENEVVVYCACPNEASAAKLAKLLMQRGYGRVRPLAGGIDAWVAAGHSIEF